MSLDRIFQYLCRFLGLSLAAFLPLLPGGNDPRGTNAVPPAACCSSDANELKKGDLTFTATLVNEKGELLSGVSVSLSDVTSERRPVAEGKSDAAGKAVFSGLRRDRNYSVAADGEDLGYTFRNREGRVFVLERREASAGAGRLEADKTAEVYVCDENAQALPGQTVLLTRGGKEICRGETDSDGLFKATGLYEGVFYELWLNGEKSAQTIISGESRTLFTENKKNNQALAIHILDADCKALAGQTVTLYDITEERRELTSLKTNENGVALFSDLKTARNYTFAVNGEQQGYTFRSSEAGTYEHSFFVADKKADATKAAENTAVASVTVFDENGVPQAGHTITLLRDGKTAAQALTNESGTAALSGLVKGTFYEIECDGVHQKDFVIGGSSQNIFVK